MTALATKRHQLARRNVTDRALRYRANATPPPGPKQCCLCGNPRGAEVGHVNGHEEDTDKRNLFWTCRSCNVKSANAMRKSGLGRLTKQYNPASKGAETLGAWMNAVASIKGEGGTMAVPEAVALIRATPHADRSKFAKEIWGIRRRRGTDTVTGRSNPASAEQKALVKLERLPKMDPAIWDRQGIYRESSGDQRKAPFKGAQSSGVRKIMSEVDAKAAKFGSLKAAINQAPLQKVSLKKLNGLQAAVDANKVRAKIQEIVKTDELAAPAVVRLRGKLYLIDGYHSLTALKLLGGKTVEASVAAL